MKKVKIYRYSIGYNDIYVVEDKSGRYLNNQNKFSYTLHEFTSKNSVKSAIQNYKIMNGLVDVEITVEKLKPIKL